MKKKIKIGISSCLLGNNVRYDGGNKRDQYVIDTFDRLVEWVPICPEVEAGMAVPREPMQLVVDGFRTRLINIDTKRDRTDPLRLWIEEKLRHLEQEGLRGFVFKARSPSCGVRDAARFSTTGASLAAGPGLFAEAVKSRFPSLPVEDEESLRDPGTRERFMTRILA